MKYANHKILIVEMDEPCPRKFIAQSNNYPVINGSGDSVDDAVEDLCLIILTHLHNKRIGRRE